MPPHSPEPFVHLIVIAKSPIPGRVKTRLCPPYTLAEAAAIAEAALVDTLTAVAGAPAVARTIVLDGPVGAWLPTGFSVIPQRGDGLDERLAAAFADAQRDCPAPVLLVGMDTPQVTSALLTDCARALLADGTDAVLGPAADGGWWSLGLQVADPALLLGVPMSTAHTWASQDQRLRDHGLVVTALPTLVDVDDADSADHVARLAPGTHFAAALSMSAIAS